MNWAEHVFSGGFGWLDAYPGRGFKHLFIFTPTWGDDPIWRWYVSTFKWVGSTTNLEIIRNDFACLILSVLIFNLSRHFSPFQPGCGFVTRCYCLCPGCDNEDVCWWKQSKEEGLGSHCSLPFHFLWGVFPKGWADLFGTKVIVVWMEAWNRESNANENLRYTWRRPS